MPNPNGTPNDKGENNNAGNAQHPGSEGQATDKNTNKNDAGNSEQITLSKAEYESLKQSNQEAQKVIKAFKQQEQERENQKKILEDQEKEKAGKFEELKSQRGDEKTELNTKVTTLSDENAGLKATVQKIADGELAKAKELFGEEKFSEVLALIGSEDPSVIISKLPSIINLIGGKPKGTPIPSGGSKMPTGKSSDDITALQTKIGNGEKISKREKAQYLSNL